MDNFFTGNPTYIMVTSTLIAKSNAQINATQIEGMPGHTFGMLDPGTIIHTSGYAAIKQKGLDGAWTSLL